MTRDEFYEWVSYHSATFDTWAAWLNKQGRDAQQQLFEVLKRSELADCKAATLAMVSGDLEPPRGFGLHAAAVRKFAFAAWRQRSGKEWQARSSRPRMVDGRRVYDCPICLDEGLVTVFCPKSILALIRGERLTVPRTAMAACSCDLGASKQRIEWKPSDSKKRETLTLSRLGEHPSVILYEVRQGRELVRNMAGLQDFLDNREELITAAATVPADEWGGN